MDINQAANPQGSRDPQHTAELGAHEGQTGQPTGVDAATYRSAVHDMISNATPSSYFLCHVQYCYTLVGRWR